MEAVAKYCTFIHIYELVTFGTADLAALGLVKRDWLNRRRFIDLLNRSFARAANRLIVSHLFIKCSLTEYVTDCFLMSFVYTGCYRNYGSNQKERQTRLKVTTILATFSYYLLNA